MEQVLYVIYGFVGGAACVGGWWFWINHRAKIRAAEQAALAAAKKI